MYRNHFFSLLRGWDKPIPEVNYLWRHRTSTPNNVEKLHLLCILFLICTFSDKNEKNNQSPHKGGTGESKIFVSKIVSIHDSESLILGFAPQFRTKVAMVRFWNKGSWRLWFGIWVLYFHRMLNITYQVLEVDWPLTLSAKIGGHVTWVICYLPPMEIMEFLRIADVLSAVFQLDQHFLS